MADFGFKTSPPCGIDTSAYRDCADGIFSVARGIVKYSRWSLASSFDGPSRPPRALILSIHPRGARFAALAVKFRQQMRAKLEIELG